MKQAFVSSFLIFTTILLLLVSIGYYFYTKFRQTQNYTVPTSAGDDIRRHAINDLATKVSFAVGNSTEAKSTLPEQWQQLGTATNDCQLQTTHCEISNQECFDINVVSNSSFKMPYDSKYGSLERTGYAIKLDGETVLLTSCYVENEPILQKIKIH